MCMFSCVVGESLRIGDVARLHVHSAEKDEVWLAIEWAEKDQAPVEIITPSDDEDSEG